MIMQQQTNEELTNLMVQSLEAKDQIALLKVLEHQDECTITDIVNRVPVHHVRKLIIELRNILSDNLTPNHLKWLQHVLASKFSVISSMPDGRSLILPLISLLDDRSSPDYYMKVQALRGKLSLLKQMKETRKLDAPETLVRIPVERDPTTHMEIDAESDTDSEEDFDEEEADGSQIEENAEEEEEEDDDEEDDDDDAYSIAEDDDLGSNKES